MPTFVVSPAPPVTVVVAGTSEVKDNEATSLSTGTTVTGGPGPIVWDPQLVLDKGLLVIIAVVLVGTSCSFSREPSNKNNAATWDDSTTRLSDKEYSTPDGSVCASSVNEATDGDLDPSTLASVPSALPSCVHVRKEFSSGSTSVSLYLWTATATATVLGCFGRWVADTAAPAADAPDDVKLTNGSSSTSTFMVPNADVEFLTMAWSLTSESSSPLPSTSASSSSLSSGRGRCAPPLPLSVCTVLDAR